MSDFREGDAQLSDDELADKLGVVMLRRLAEVDWAAQVARRNRQLSELLPLVEQMARGGLN